MAGRVQSLRARRPVAMFVLLFGLTFGVLHVIVGTDTFERYVWRPYLTWNAKVAGAMMRGIGEKAVVKGRTIEGEGLASIVVERGCDGIYPSILFGSAVIASPFRVRSRLLGLIAGMFILMAINIFRIASLFYIRVHRPDWFEMAHIEIWQFVFVVLAIGIWIGWAQIALRRERLPAPIAAKT